MSSMYMDQKNIVANYLELQENQFLSCELVSFNLAKINKMATQSPTGQSSGQSL